MKTILGYLIVVAIAVSFCIGAYGSYAFDWVHVCTEHDVALNELTVRTIFGAEYDSELADYRALCIPEKETT